MKTTLTLVTGLLLAASALADGRVTYFASYDRDNTRVSGSINFQGFGKVAADLVCVTADQSTLKTVIPAHQEKVCDKSYWDNSDSNNPRVRCTASHLVDVAEQALETPVQYLAQVCTKEVVDRSDSTHPKTTCLESSEQLVSQPLSYELATYAPSDYRKEHPVKTQIVSIAVCK